MSQRDLAAELRAARIEAPDHVREQVRLIAASAAPPARRLTWRRALVVALPAAAAIAAAVIVARPSTDHRATPVVVHGETAPAAQQGKAFRAQAQPNSADAGRAPAPSQTRAQTYGAYLSLRISTRDGVSDGVKRALAIASSLGGYPVSVHASTATAGASADVTLKVPRTHVAQAITRLSALGTIVGEQVDVQDAQAGLNATDRLIARLQRQLAELRAQEQTDAVRRQLAAITARIATLQRQEAAKIRATHYATIRLHLATKPVAVPPKHHGHGPLHGLGVAFRWIGIGAVYALALGGPLVLLIGLTWLAARTIRRRREDALLNRA
jgi:uncharacterized protein DUF4349